ncbi:Phage terminase-like protein, large subunit [Bacteroidales bacterium Barb6XT]|nr:Phage terminase-like protein, large subunit [Bacteroidales bacterium Barb6XT]
MELYRTHPLRGKTCRKEIHLGALASVHHCQHIRLQYVYIEDARKNGKSALATALCLYHLIADGESSAEVYLAANSRDQVKLSSWPLCSNFAKGIDPNGELLDVFRDTVRLDSVQSWLKVLAADSTKLDGPNPSVALTSSPTALRCFRSKRTGSTETDSRNGLLITPLLTCSTRSRTRT